jgi:phosphatidylglycerophosphatase A
MSRLAVLIATAGGAGYFPFAPGTVGSAVGIVIYLLTRHLSPPAQVVILIAVSLVGTWASTVAARHFDREDPGHVVIDEVAGQLMTLLLLDVGWMGATLGFFLFRILDIIKPWPANRLEALHGGVGIMADDLMAGAYGWLLLWGALMVAPWLR